VPHPLRSLQRVGIFNLRIDDCKIPILRKERKGWGTLLDSTASNEGVRH